MAERRGADILLARLHELLTLSLAAAASRAQVSESTVIRCCRPVGCHGFAYFKMRMAQSLASGQLYLHADVAVQNSVAEMATEVFGKTARTLRQVRSHLDPLRLERAIAFL